MTDPVRDLASEVRPPEFDTLVRRAARRRVRRRVGAVVASAVVVAGGAVTVAALQPSGPRTAPAGPPSSSVPPSGTAKRLWFNVNYDAIARAGHLVGFAADGRGGLLTEWRKCGHGCQYVYLFRGNGADRAVGTDQQRYAAADPGFVMVSLGGADGSLYRDGSMLRVHETSGGSPLASAKVMVPGKDGLMAVDPGSRTMWLLPADCVPRQVGWADATISSTGTIFAFPVTDTTTGGKVPLCSSTDGVTWHVTVANLNPDPPASAGQVVAPGDHVAALSSGDDGMPADPFWVSADGGAHWSTLQGLPFDRVDSMAATSDGVLFVADMAGKVYRSTDWSTFTVVPDAAGIWSLHSDGMSVAGQGGNFQDPKIFTISSAGAVAPWPDPLR